MKKKTIIIVIISILVLITAVVIANVTVRSNERQMNNEKVISKLEYLEKEIIELFEIYQEQYEGTGVEIDWKGAEKKISNLYYSWNEMIIDLTAFTIDHKNLTDFGKKLDALAIANQKKNITRAMEININLYRLILTYLEPIENTSTIKNTLTCKYYLLKGCYLLNSNNWTLISDAMDKSLAAFYPNITKLENRNKENFLNQKIYITLNELKNSLPQRNKNLFYNKYKMVMEEFKN